MRMKPEKVEYLAKKITERLHALKKLEFSAPDPQVEGTVYRVFLDDLRREEQIEHEAEEILRQHRQHINLRNLSYSTLLQKTKKELARQKKVVL